MILGQKKICVFTVTCQKNLGLALFLFFLFFYFIFLLLSAKPEISDSGNSFSKFPVSRHLF